MSSHQHGDLAGLKRPDEIDEVFGRANPNPERIGCPPHDVLVALVRKERPISDPAYDHLGECSPCYLEVRALKEAADLRRRRMLTWAAAAALILATGSGGWLFVNRESGTREPATLQAQLDLRPYAISRGEPQQGTLPPLEVQRGRVPLTLLLPTGSEPGPYTVEIRDSSSATVVSARGNAALRNQVTTLEVLIDFSAFSPGGYQLAVRREENDWQVFPLRLN
jgi:hypothetical protein